MPDTPFICPMCKHTYPHDHVYDPHEDAIDRWVRKLGADAWLAGSIGMTVRVYGEDAVARAYAMLQDKEAATGDDATPLKNRQRYMMWCLDEVRGTSPIHR